MSAELLEPFVFRIDELEDLAKRRRDDYLTGRPFPYVVIDDFLPLPYADRILEVFPDQDSPIWLDWKKRDVVHQPRKQGIGHASRLADVSPYLQNMLLAFNSYPFLNFLEKLTGIEKLLPDPHFHGGGLHQILSGGELAIHADSNDLIQLDVYRRLNILLYLNKDWRPEYRGDLELWDENLQRSEKSIPPIFNRLVVFGTNKKTFHGHPAPLNTPPEVTRKSIALYYYTAKPAPDEKYDTVINWKGSADNKPEIETMSRKAGMFLIFAVLAFVIAGLRFVPQVLISRDVADFAGGLGFGLLIGVLVTWTGETDAIN